MLPDVSDIKPLPNYILQLTFSNGEQKRFDMTPYLQYPVFQRLKNPGFFKLAKVDYGTVTCAGRCRYCTGNFIPGFDFIGAMPL